MEPISFVLITHDSEKTLDNCLNSLKELASEIIIVDGYSRDRTLDIAAKYDAKIYKKNLEGFGSQKQFALEKAKNDWVFIIDSDEAISSDLSWEINDRIADVYSKSAYRVPRKNYYFGKWLKHGRKYPDYQTRLIKRQFCKFSEDVIHEKIIVDGETGTLVNPLTHNSYPDMDTWFSKLKMFAEFRAERLLREGAKPSAFNFFKYCMFRPVWRLDKRFFLDLGFMDGLPGLLACIHDVLTEILGYFIFTRKYGAAKK